MYVIPLIVVIVLALIAVAWSPVFALVFFVLFMLGFFAYVGLRRRSVEQPEPVRQPGQRERRDDEDAGLWGERRPS